MGELVEVDDCWWVMAQEIAALYRIPMHLLMPFDVVVRRRRHGRLSVRVSVWTDQM